eukprot:NODE_923_length_1115_cov_129.281377_g880_i0.p1 GENE.NODE_923_length_1115_cov_129.281377_g880_i0~~NODE_923_length_1115_cov_129.281377_g880_i0.p1  ORF type:complete len:250 (+),score=48.87 NODE_923_length_1115_cov_129.281377_g880_i0:81-830(+)
MGVDEQQPLYPSMAPPSTTGAPGTVAQGAYQQQGVMPTGGGSPEWSNSLIGCDKELSICLYAWLCPTCATARARSDYDSSNWCFNCMTLSPCLARNIIREGYGIEGSCAGDICVPWWCGPCAVAQMLAEVRNRGAIQAGAGVGTANQWSNGTFSCLGDIPFCLYAWCFPNCAMASARNDWDNSNWCFNCLVMHPALLRNMVREAYGIEGDCLGDLCWSCWCPLCVITQTRAEIKARGPLSNKPGGQKMV